jgi:hypothetical protein
MVTYTQVSNIMTQKEKKVYAKVAKREGLNSLREMINQTVIAVNDNKGDIEDAKEILHGCLRNVIPFA